MIFYDYNLLIIRLHVCAPVFDDFYLLIVVFVLNQSAHSDAYYLYF